MLNATRRKKLLFALVLLASSAVVAFPPYRLREAVLFAGLSDIEKKIVGAWSWTYLEGVGRMVFTANHYVKEGFPPDGPNAPAVRDSDFTYSLSGSWRVEGDTLITEIDNHLLINMFSRHNILDRFWGAHSTYKPEFEKKVRHDRIVRLDNEKMVFADGHSLDRVKR